MSAPAPDWGVYIHFPWCARVCPYCDFNVHRAGDLPHVAYADAVLAQWDQARPEFPEHAPATVFFGGGTPSLWDPEQVRRIIERLAPAHVGLEANPEDADDGRWAALCDAGVGRLSLGVQSFEQGVLRTLGRVHSVDEGLRAVDLAQQAGFAQVSLDLIFGVPGQKRWSETLQRAVGSGVGHVSAYSLTIERGTQFAALGVGTSGEGAELSMLREAVATLGAAGLRRYEVSNYAREGAQSRHNRLYWEGRPWLGLGAGAHSHLPTHGGARRWACVRRPSEYLARAADGGGDWVEELGPSEVLRERVIMGLRLVEGTPLPQGRFGGQVALLRGAGLLAPDDGDGRVRATGRGMEVLDAVISALDGALSG